MLWTLLLLSLPTPALSAYWETNQSHQYQNGTLFTDRQQPLNRYFQSSVHNAYLTSHSLFDILKGHSTNIELDIFDVRDANAWFNKTYLSGDWYVRHDSNDPSENVMCLPDGDHDYLSECLDEIMRFHHYYPNHELITLWLDKKQSWQPEHECQTGVNSPCRRPQDLDALLTQKLGHHLFSPRHMTEPHQTSLREVAQQGHWPTLAELQGKIMVIMTDAKYANNTNLKGYLDEQRNNAVAFVAPKMTFGTLDEPSQLHAHKDDIVFYNLDSRHRFLGPEIFQLGRISRTWGTNLSDSSSHDYRGYLIQNGAGDDYTQSERYNGALLADDIPLFTSITSQYLQENHVPLCLSHDHLKASNIELQSCEQAWLLIPTHARDSANPLGPFYINALTGNRMDIESHNSQNGVNIHLWSPSQTNNQAWMFTPSHNNSYQIQNTLSGLCMDIFAFGQTASDPLVQWQCNQYQNQQFHLISSF